MPKLTINEKDYYTDDFSKSQMTMYNEIQGASGEMSRLDYLSKVLGERREMLAGMIVKEAEQPEAEEPEDG